MKLTKPFPYTEDLKFLFNLFGDDNIRLVGGCIRNFLLEKTLSDYDLATTFKPNKVIKILEENKIKYTLIGVKFGTITAIINGVSFEITTLRNDFNTDGRHADVKFIKSYEEDAKRRDFTFNALYLDGNNNLYDYFYGIEDLKNHKIKFIGDADKRIKEDYLRILRFFRFYSEYADIYDNNDFQACIKNMDGLSKLSRERIKSEFIKILESKKYFEVLNLMKQYNFLKYIFGKNDIDLSNVEKFYNSKENNIKPDGIMILSLILQNNYISDIKDRLRLTKKEICKINPENYRKRN